MIQSKIKFSREPKYTTSDGDQFDTLAGAQRHELVALLLGEVTELMEAREARLSVIDSVLTNQSAVLAILKQTKRVRVSKPAKKKRAAATPTENAQPK